MEIYGLSNFVSLLVILARFFIFSQYVDSNSLYAENYSYLAFCNAILPFLLIGLSFGQNSVYARFYKSKKKNNLINFYKLSLIFLSTISLVFFLVAKNFEILEIYAFALIQFTLNFFYHQKRYEKISQSLILNSFEIIFILTLTIFSQSASSNFKYLFTYYAFILLVNLIKDIFNLNTKIKINSLKESISFNFKNMLLISPIFIKDNLDILLIGIFSNKEISSIYAIVILASAPSKIFLSTLQVTLNKYFADKNIYYKNFFKKLNKKIIYLIISTNLIFIYIILKIFFSDIGIKIYLLTFIRSLGLLAGFKMRSSYLDLIQLNTSLIIKKYRQALLFSFSIFVIYLSLYSYFRSIYLLSFIPLIFSIVGRKWYESNEFQTKSS